MFERLDYVSINRAAVGSMLSSKKHMTSIDKKLRAMLEIRISQINGCAFCVDLHITQAREAGETQQRLDCLAVWPEAPFFSKAERAALAWAEAVTNLPIQGAPDDLFNELKSHYRDEEIVDITLIIAQMNAWNRMAVSLGQMPDARD